MFKYKRLGVVYAITVNCILDPIEMAAGDLLNLIFAVITDLLKQI